MAFSCSRLLSRIHQEFIETRTESSGASDPIVNDILQEIITTVSDELLREKILNNTHNSEIKNSFACPETDLGNNISTFDENVEDGFSYEEIQYDFCSNPTLVAKTSSEFSMTSLNNCTKGCKWAPDGLCILTSSEDNILRIFNLPSNLWNADIQTDNVTELESVVKISEGDLVYDYCWYPQMNSADPSTCCLASTCKAGPVHLWDGFNGELRCSYRAFDHLDELSPAKSISFDSEGEKLFCGFEKIVRVFDVSLPGRKCQVRKIFDKSSGQCGIISCFAFSPSNKSISAAGSYSKSIGIYSEPDGSLEYVLEGQKGGVTKIQFSPDGNLLYSGGRKDPEILCWDMRYPGDILYCLRRSCSTHQRMYFDISRCGRYIVSGNYNGIITVWDSLGEIVEASDSNEYSVLQPIKFYLAHNDCVNGLSVHPYLPLICSSSGQRKVPELSECDEEMFSPNITKLDNSLKLWWIGKCHV